MIMKNNSGNRISDTVMVTSKEQLPGSWWQYEAVNGSGKRYAWETSNPEVKVDTFVEIEGSVVRAPRDNCLSVLLTGIVATTVTIHQFLATQHHANTWGRNHFHMVSRLLNRKKR